MARPKLNIDSIEVEKLAAMGCTNTEIAAFFDCNETTIRDRFPEVLAKGREKGKTKLRRLQWQSAEKGNVVMQIWLGKQILGQSDRVENNGNTGIKIEVVDYINATKNEIKNSSTT